MSFGHVALSPWSLFGIDASDGKVSDAGGVELKEAVSGGTSHIDSCQVRQRGQTKQLESFKWW